VATDDPAAGAAMVALLRDAAMVVVEREHGPLAEAFEAKGYPAIGRLGEDGVVLVNRAPDAVAVPVGA
jgi:hypothetical protein